VDDRVAIGELDRVLTVALEKADALNLTMVGIHIEEARTLLPKYDAAPDPHP